MKTRTKNVVAAILGLAFLVYAGYMLTILINQHEQEKDVVLEQQRHHQKWVEYRQAHCRLEGLLESTSRFRCDDGKIHVSRQHLRGGSEIRVAPETWSPTQP